MKNGVSYGITCGVALLGGVAALVNPSSMAQAAATFSESLIGGKASLDVRYRYEHVEQDNALQEATASTVRSRLGYLTDPFHGVNGYLEFENITVVGDENYNSGVNGKTQYSLVSDPEGTEVNQAYLSVSTLPATVVKVGRQRLLLDNQRFVGNVGWRQNEQTFDAVSLANKSLPDTTITYAHLSNVNRITGLNANMASDILNASYGGWTAGTLSAYVYLLDYAQGASASTRTAGVRFTGAAKLSEQAKLLYTAEWAQQGDYADNPASYDLNYLFAEVGGALSGVTAKLGYEALEGDGTRAVQTPLATLHAFNGWADQFLTTPAAGLEDTYLSVGGALLGVDLLVVYHDYAANSGGGDYGTELNFQAAKKFAKLYTVTAKYASYSAGDLAGKVDTDKVWLMGQVAF
ncbi:MAG: alginate export family protein [Pseudomonadota bacterium]